MSDSRDQPQQPVEDVATPDLLQLTPEELRGISVEHLRERMNQLGSDGLKRFAPEQVAVIMEILDSRFALTPDEQRRRDAALKLVGAKTWQLIASSCVEPIIRTYETGELTLPEAIRIIGRISIGCLPQARVQLLGVVAALALRTPTVEERLPGERRPTYPASIKSGTADLILTLSDAEPHLRRSPSAYDRTSPIIEKAIPILTILEWFGDAPTPSPTTINDWVIARLAERGELRPRGRPRTTG